MPWKFKITSKELLTAKQKELILIIIKRRHGFSTEILENRIQTILSQQEYDTSTLMNLWMQTNNTTRLTCEQNNSWWKTLYSSEYEC